MLTTAEVALIVSVVALIGTGVTVFQKRYTDRRDAWWERTQWALERVLADPGGDDTDRTVGLVMLIALQRSVLASRDDREMLDQIAEGLLPPPPEDEIP